MNAQELRNLQAPIKARYKENPESAKLTMGASGVLLHDRPTCRVESRFGHIDAGLHPAAGGDGTRQVAAGRDWLRLSRADRVLRRAGGSLRHRTHRADDALQDATLKRLMASLVLAAATAPARIVGLRKRRGRLSSLQHQGSV